MTVKTSDTSQTSQCILSCCHTCAQTQWQRQRQRQWQSHTCAHISNLLASCYVQRNHLQEYARFLALYLHLDTDGHFRNWTKRVAFETEIWWKPVWIQIYLKLISHLLFTFIEGCSAKIGADSATVCICS